MTIERIIKKTLENNPDADVSLIQLAYDYAEKAHRGQKRKTGEDYIQHSLHTAFILAQIKADCPTVIAGILHDVPEDTDKTIEDVIKNFGPEIGFLVEGITKLGKIKYRGKERYRESLKKMILAMVKDLRVVLIKCSDRLHNLRTLEGLPYRKQQRIAKETLEIYASIAGLLGIERLKWQMEDLCFKYIYPKEYYDIEYKHEIEKKYERNKLIQEVRQTVKKRLASENLEYKIEYRTKHLYSIYRKMQIKNKPYDEIYDVFAFRIISKTITDCYKILGIIHEIWKPKHNKIKDYISLPKPNGYRSLHTTIFGPNGKTVEFQIRTTEMDDEAKYGIAAHWHYKTKGSAKEEAPAWIKEILDTQKTIKNTNEFIKQVKLNVFRHRIFVFSPKGDAFELPDKATPIDFAYAVHTDIGNKASIAFVNQEITSLNHELNNGDVVDIKIDKKRKGPSSNWLKFVKTKKAKERIKQYSKRMGFDLKKFFYKQ